jgi:hypothetical protein
MRSTRLMTAFSVSAFFGVLLSVAVVSHPLPAKAADDEESFDQKLIGSLLEGIGLQRDRPGIDYHERAPLVIPTGRDLPPPEAADAVASNNPAWPKDPDVTRRKEQKRLERERNKVSSTDRIEDDARPLLPNKLAPGGGNSRTASRARSADAYNTPQSEYGDRLTPSELGYKGGLFNFFGGKSDEPVRFTKEPARAALTDPPTGYQTPSPDQPYGPGKAAAPKAENFLLNHGVDDGQ